jgi:hypothetical protein
VKVEPKVLPESRQIKMTVPRRPLKQLHGFDMESVAQRVIAMMSKGDGSNISRAMAAVTRTIFETVGTRMEELERRLESVAKRLD